MRFAVNSYVPFLIPQTDDPYETVCDGCQTACDRCSFDEPPLVPACSEVMEHAVSPGGVVTLEMLEIEPGYWRATETSTDILACYNEDACLGGATGAAGNCLEGYEGPCEYFRVGVRAVRERSRCCVIRPCHCFPQVLAVATRAKYGVSFVGWNAFSWKAPAAGLLDLLCGSLTSNTNTRTAWSLCPPALCTAVTA